MPSGPCPDQRGAPRRFCCPAPLRGIANRSDSHFKAPVRFNQETATLIFPVADLETSIAGADPLLRAIIEEQIRKMKGNQRSEFADDVRRLLRVRLTGKVEDIADLLAMNRRTLSRRLRGTGTPYSAIANEVRFETARQLLEDTKVPLSQIAAALGYSEASAFARAFKRWSGKTPTSWRAEGNVREVG